jgi:hypothetical protein
MSPQPCSSSIFLSPANPVLRRCSIGASSPRCTSSRTLPSVQWLVFELWIRTGAASRRVDPQAPYFCSAIPTNVILCRTARAQRISVHCRRIRWINRKVGFLAPIVHRARRCEMSLLHHRPIIRVFTDIRILTPANIDIARFPL